MTGTKIPVLSRASFPHCISFVTAAAQTTRHRATIKRRTKLP